MEYKMLYILVEGNNDEDLLKKISPLLEERNRLDATTIIKYRERNTPPKKMRDFVFKITNSIPYANYVFLVDINSANCPIQKKQEIKKEIETIDEKKIIVVIKEIESWYLAGLSAEKCKKLRIKNLPNTDDVTKEKFNNLTNNSIIKKFSKAKIYFMQELLKNFSITTAKRKNKSFRHFAKKFNL